VLSGHMQQSRGYEKLPVTLAMLEDDRVRKHDLLHRGLPSRKLYEITEKYHTFHEAKACVTSQGFFTYTRPSGD
jgi:hypothetical protein